MINGVEHTGPTTSGVAQTAKELSQSLMRERGGVTGAGRKTAASVAPDAG